MTATGARRGHLVYHWKHGWIPLDHFAALSKAKGSHKSAAKIMERHGITAPGHHSSSEKTHPVGAWVRATQPGLSHETHGKVVGHTDSGMLRVQHQDRLGKSQVGTFNPAHTTVVAQEAGKRRTSAGANFRAEQAKAAAAAAHPAPHTLKLGDRATVAGVDEHGAPIHFTGEVRGTTAVTATLHGKKTPMLGITVKRESPTTGAMRHDTVYVPDPNRDPAKIDAARKAAGERDQLRKELNAKYAGQGAPYMRQQHGIDPAAMSNADLAKYRESLHAEHDHVLLSDGKKLRDKMDAEHAKRTVAKPSAKASRFTVSEVPSQLREKGIAGGATHTVFDNHAGKVAYHDNRLAYVKGRAEAKRVADKLNAEHDAGRVPSWEASNKAKLAAMDAETARRGAESLRNSANAKIGGNQHPLDNLASQLRTDKARAAMQDQRSVPELGRLATALEQRHHDNARAIAARIDTYEAHAGAHSGAPSRAAMSKVLSAVHQDAPRKVLSADNPNTWSLREGRTSSGEANGLYQIVDANGASRSRQFEGPRSAQQELARHRALHDANHPQASAPKKPAADYSRLSAAALRERITKGDANATLELQRRAAKRRAIKKLKGAS